MMYSAEEPGCYEDAYMTWLRTEYPEHVEKFRIPRSSSPNRPRSKPNENFAYEVDAPWEASFSGWIATMASNFLSYRATRDPDHRHFMHLGFYAPHPPLNPTTEMLAPYKDVEIPPFRFDPDEWEDKSDPFRKLLRSRLSWPDEKLMLYKHYFYAMVTGVDMAVGRIMDALEKAGQLDDTLIVFSSDHGDMLGDHRMLGKGNPYYYDEVMRVPCVLHWPNGFGMEGRTVDGLIEKLDVLPTLLELCGGHVPEVMSGRSYAKDLLAGQVPETREDVLAFSHPNWAMLRTEEYKYCRFPSLGTETVFDLQADPNEGCDITRDRPDVVQELRTQLLDRLLDACRSPREHVYLF